MLKHSLFLGAFLALGSVAQAADAGDWITTWAASPQPIWSPDFFAPDYKRFPASHSSRRKTMACIQIFPFGILNEPWRRGANAILRYPTPAAACP